MCSQLFIHMLILKIKNMFGMMNLNILGGNLKDSFDSQTIKEITFLQNILADDIIFRIFARV